MNTMKHTLVIIISFILAAVSQAADKIEIHVFVAETPSSFEGPSDPNAFLELAAKTQGVDLLSTPKVVTQSGHSAKIEVTREFITKEDVSYTIGIKFTVTPEIERERISFKADYESIQFEGFLRHSDSESPIFDIRKISDIRGSAAGPSKYLFPIGVRQEQQTILQDGKPNKTEVIEKKVFLVMDIKKA